MNTIGDDATKVIYWHRELPPLDAEALDEHTVEATSNRVPGTLAHRDDLWDRCYQELMSQARLRLQQEVARLHGDFAHVFDEAIDTRHDDAKGEAWLHGRFGYVLYRRGATG
jgi:acyl-coenzyme A synthetase/AMP-(fatty) acid ligase